MADLYKVLGRAQDLATQKKVSYKVLGKASDNADSSQK